jgi:hypothetical protein
MGEHLQNRTYYLHVHLTSTLMLEALCSSETLVTTYKSTKMWHNPYGRNMKV